MLFIVVAEALRRPWSTMPRRLVADGAVRACRLITRAVFSMRSNGLRSLPLPSSTLLQQIGQLAKADAAGNTFAAGLRMAQAQERSAHISTGHSPGGLAADAPLDIAVQAGNDGLSLARRFNG